MIGQRETKREEIERLVREVVSRLLPGVLTEMPQDVPGKLPTKPIEELTLTARLVSLGEIEGRLNGIKRLVVPPRAVITPAVRDLLRTQGVSISYAVAKDCKNKKSIGLVLGIAESTLDGKTLATGLKHLGMDVELLPQGSLPQVLAALIESVTKQGRSGVLLTSESEAALCLANRHRSVRAMLGRERMQIRKAVRAIGANMLVVEPAGRSTFELRQMIVEFGSAERSEVPALLAP
jgi:hypothetical protein